jgi:5-methylcytosine-specific restriction endonuclease McrA
MPSRLYRRADSPYWWISFKSPHGKRVRKSTGTSDRALAQRMLTATEARVGTARFLSIIQEEIPLTPRPDDFQARWRPRWLEMNPRERLAVIFVLFEGTCVYCSEHVRIPLRRETYRNPKMAVLDHRIPVSGGGSDMIENLVLSCHQCNMKKLDRSPDLFALNNITAPAEDA